MHSIKTIILIFALWSHVLAPVFATQNPTTGGGKLSHSQQFNQLTSDELLQRVADKLKKKQYTLSTGMARTTDRITDRSTRLAGYERTIPLSLSYRWNDSWKIGFTLAERVSNSMCADPASRIQGMGHTIGLNASYSLLPWLTAIGGFLHTTHTTTLWVRSSSAVINPAKSTLKAFTALLGIQAFLPFGNGLFVMPVWSVTGTHNRTSPYQTVTGTQRPAKEKQIYQNNISTRIGFYKWGWVVPYISAGINTPFKVHNLKTRHTGQVGTGAILAGFLSVEWFISKTPSLRKAHTFNTNLTWKF